MADEQEKNPFEGFKTTRAVDGVEIEDAPKSDQRTSVPPVDDEEDSLAEFSDQGDDNAESDADVVDDDDGAAPDEEHDAGDGDSDPGDGSAEDEDDQPRRKPKVPAKARIAELTKARRDAEREAAALRARLEELEAKRPQADDGDKGDKGDDAEADKKPAIIVKDENGNTLEEPDPRKYKYGEVDSAYLRDLRKYDRLALKAEIAQEQERTRQEQAAQRQAEELNTARERLIEDGGSRYDDFDDVVVQGAAQGAFALDQATFEMAAESEVGADILYHLAKNPATSVKVAQMNEREKARYLGRLEAALETRVRGKEPPKKRKGPQAAPPPKSHTPRGRGGRFTNPASSTNFADFEAAWERSQQKR